MEEFDLENFPTSESAKKMLCYVSDGFYDKSYVGKWLFQVMGMEYDKALEIVEDLPNQFFIETATWGLMYHEMKWGLPVRENLSYEERRKLIYQKRDERAPMSPYAMENYLSHFTDFEVHISDVHDVGEYGFVPTHPNLFQVTFIGEGTLESNRVLNALRKIKQSHTDFIANEWIRVFLRFIVFYEVRLQLLIACYPRYNIPYFFYDGTVQYNGGYRYDKYKIGTKMDFYPMALSIQMETKITCCRYKIDLTVGYHLTKYDGTYQYDGLRRYDSQIIHYENIGKESEKMADAVITKKGREKLCQAHAGDLVLPKLKYVAYGDGGVDESRNPFPITGEEVSLRNEQLRMELDAHYYPIPTTCEYQSELSKNSLANVYLSEMGIFDEEGDLIIYRTFLPKGKDDDMLFNFSIQEIF